MLPPALSLMLLSMMPLALSLIFSSDAIRTGLRCKKRMVGTCFCLSAPWVHENKCKWKKKMWNKTVVFAMQHPSLQIQPIHLYVDLPGLMHSVCVGGSTHCVWHGSLKCSDETLTVGPCGGTLMYFWAVVVDGLLLAVARPADGSVWYPIEALWAVPFSLS